MHSDTYDTGELPRLSNSAGTHEDDTASGGARIGVIGLYQKMRDGDSDATIEEDVKEIEGSYERLERREQILFQYSEQELVAALWWMIQQGREEKDLDAVRRRAAELNERRDPRLGREGVRRLLRLAEQKIIERLNDPARVARKGEEAYRRHRKRWEREFGGEYIAIHRGEVVAHAVDKSELLRKIVELQRREWPFRAYVVQVGAPAPPLMRGPRVGPRTITAGKKA